MKKALKEIISKFIFIAKIIYLLNCKNKITIFMFHKINNNDKSCLTIVPEIFEEIVVYLRNRYDLISLDHAVKRIEKRVDVKGCVLTFDDGYRDNYDYAYPILKKHRVPATFYKSYFLHSILKHAYLIWFELFVSHSLPFFS